MRREASIPLFLWAASAILAHLLWSGGADQAARLIDERLDVASFAAGIRSHVRGAVAPPIEIAINDESAPDEAKPDEKKPEPVPVPEEKKPEPPKPERVLPATPAEEPKPIPQLDLPKKIAVTQHVEDEHQKDNPDA